MKKDMSILATYVRTKSPDKTKLAELVIRAKGPKLSMAQFAKKCEVNPSTLSRIVNQKTAGKNSDALILSIAEHADPDSGVTFEMLMDAHGMTKRNMNGKVDTETYKTFERNAERLVLQEIIKRGYTVSIPQEPIVYNALNYHYRPDWGIMTDAVTDNGNLGTWQFEFWTMLGSQQQAVRQQTMKLRQKLLMVLGLYYMQEIKTDKFSFVVFDKKFYELLVSTLDGIVLNNWISILYFDLEEEKFQAEYNFPMRDGEKHKDIFFEVDDEEEEKKKLEDSMDLFLTEE